MYQYPVPSPSIQLGALYDKTTKSVCFSIWAPSSFDVKVNLYKEHLNITPDYTILADFDRATGVWHAMFNQEDPENMAYNFSIRTICGTYTCLDPYAKSMAAFRNDGSMGRGVIVDMKSAKAGGNLSFCRYIPLKHYSDAIIYEVSVRDFTSSPDAQTSNPGSYLAFIEKIPYLKSLGITHIQLMPVLNFYFNDELIQRYENTGTVHGNNYNWGYDPHSYFSPEGWFSSNPSDAYARIRELRQLIASCHEAGIGVVLDVVYNHMAKIDLLDTIVPSYFFRKNKDGSLKNNSSCGNDTASEMPMMHRLIVDSLVYWTKQYCVDGFRFDLMGLIESSVITEALKKCRAINPYTIFIGEGWKMYDGPEDTHGMDQSLIVSTTDIAVFSDEYRDIIKAGGLNEDSKGFVTGKETNTYDLFQNCLGNPQSYFKSTTPENVVNYVACHDGLTLHDCIAHNCHLTENTSSEKAELLLRIKLANFILLTSRGIAFLNAGQERGRTKSTDCKSSNECVGRFVRNSYNSSDNINNFVWNLDKEYLKLLEYTKRLILFRKAHSIFRNNFNECDNAQILSDIPKKALVIGYILSDRCREDDTKKNVNLGKYVVLVNASKKKYKFNLSKTITRGTQTIKVVFDANGELKTAGVTIKKSKVLVAELECFSSVILYIQ